MRSYTLPLLLLVTASPTLRAHAQQYICADYLYSAKCPTSSGISCSGTYTTADDSYTGSMTPHGEYITCCNHTVYNVTYLGAPYCYTTKLELGAQMQLAEMSKDSPVFAVNCDGYIRPFKIVAESAPKTNEEQPFSLIHKATLW